MRNDLPYSQACENNKQAILEALSPLLHKVSSVLEVGSGTGQHAVHFAANLPHISWQTSDLLQNHAGILAWIEHSGLANIIAPIELDVRNFAWPRAALEAIYCANSIHIMSWESAQMFIVDAVSALGHKGQFVLYGPFNYDGSYTSESNRSFDQWLKIQNPESGIREFEQVDDLMRQGGLELVRDTTMPANNRLIAWRKS